MKTFWKTFIVSIIFFLIATYLGSYSYLKINKARIHPNISSADEEQEIKIENTSNKKDKTKENESYSSLREALKNSKRINILLLGLEDVRTDTIIFASFHPENKKVDIISIPRDTYIHRKGYDKGEQRKINAIYASHGVEGVKKAVSYLLEGAPIHNYIIVDYKGVENIIDSIGGVEVMVPFPMKYTDPVANPPLNINIPEGKQVLNGKESMNFLRYRKGNDKNSGYIDGDLGRIKAQQQFLKSFVDKALSYRLPLVVKKGFEHVKTDIKLIDGLNYSTSAIGIKTEDFTFKTLPGASEFRRINGKLLSYFTYNSLETKNLLKSLYNIKKSPKS